MARRPMPRIGSWLRRGALCLAVLAIALLRCLRPVPPPGSFATLAQQARDRDLARRAAPRPVTHGEVTADNAFEHYANAMRAWDAVRRERDIVRVSWNAPTGSIRFASKQWKSLASADVATFRSSIAPALMAMQRGAHASDMTPRPLHDLSPRGLRDLAQTEIAVRVHEGDADGAVELWLDAITFELDFGNLLGFSDSAWTDAAVAALSPSAAMQLSAGLAVLDNRLDRPADAAAAMAKYVIPLLEGRFTIADWGAHEVLDSWEFGFDPTARNLAAFDLLFAQLHRLEPVAATGRARAAQWDDFIAAEHGLAISTFRSSHAARPTRLDEQSRQRLLTSCRQIRIGLAAKRGQPQPELCDPFTGAPFRIEQTATELIVHAEVPPHGPGPARWSLPAPPELTAPFPPAGAARR